MGYSQSSPKETFDTYENKVNEVLFLKITFFKFYFLAAKKGLKEGNWRIAGCYLNEIQNKFDIQLAEAHVKKAYQKNSIDGIILTAISTNNLTMFQVKQILHHPYAQFWRAKYHFYTIQGLFFRDEIIQWILKSPEIESSVALEVLGYLNSHKNSFTVDDNVKEKLIQVANSKIGSECSFFIGHEISAALWPII
jgi:hypothetical protein